MRIQYTPSKKLAANYLSDMAKNLLSFRGFFFALVEPRHYQKLWT